MYNKTMGCLNVLHMVLKPCARPTFFLRIIQFCVFFLMHIYFLVIIKFLLFLPHVRNVTSRYKISPMIFTITIIFCRHVTNITSLYKISSILGCRAPLDTIISSCFNISSILVCRGPLDEIILTKFH